jgi:hypothetical protein
MGITKPNRCGADDLEKELGVSHTCRGPLAETEASAADRRFNTLSHNPPTWIKVPLYMT